MLAALTITTAPIEIVSAAAPHQEQVPPNDAEYGAHPSPSYPSSPSISVLLLLLTSHSPFLLLPRPSIFFP